MIASPLLNVKEQTASDTTDRSHNVHSNFDSTEVKSRAFTHGISGFLIAGQLRTRSMALQAQKSNLFFPYSPPGRNPLSDLQGLRFRSSCKLYSFKQHLPPAHFFIPLSLSSPHFTQDMSPATFYQNATFVSEVILAFAEICLWKNEIQSIEVQYGDMREVKRRDWVVLIGARRKGGGVLR